MRIPGPVARLSGWGAIVGAIVWPVGLSLMAETARLAPLRGEMPTRGFAFAGLPVALAILLFAAAVATLELRATTAIRLSDLVGDLSIAMAAAVFLVAMVTDEEGLFGPGFVVLCVGSVIFGLAGLDGRRRPRWASALIGAGAGGLLACLVSIGTLGPAGLEGVAGAALVSILLYSAGWAWLGVHLALARPLATRAEDP
jgi:hypothetical protein